MVKHSAMLLLHIRIAHPCKILSIGDQEYVKKSDGVNKPPIKNLITRFGTTPVTMLTLHELSGSKLNAWISCVNIFSLLNHPCFLLSSSYAKEYTDDPSALFFGIHRCMWNRNMDSERKTYCMFFFLSGLLLTSAIANPNQCFGTQYPIAFILHAVKAWQLFSRILLLLDFTRKKNV